MSKSLPSASLDLTGQKFGMLVAVAFVERKSGQRYWTCRCECGQETVVTAGNLKKGNTKSCGCLRVRSASETKLIDISGHRFGRLVVVARSGFTPNGKKVKWLCHCDCGNSCFVIGSHLRSGQTTSCGCRMREVAGTINLKHGLARTGKISAEFRTLMNMWERCFNPKNKRYDRYGGRGITVCDRWLHGEEDVTAVECFVSDMGSRPSPKHSIDRINNDGNYEPGNCRWATASQQIRNRSPKRWAQKPSE